MSEHLEELKKRLYKSGESFEGRLRRPELTPHPEKLPSDWKNEIKQEKKTPGNKKFWILGVVLAAILGGGFYYFILINSVSAKRIDTKINGPESIVGGERVTWEVVVSNNNKKALEGAQLSFEYPEGSKVLDEGVKGLHASKIVGEIGPGKTERFVYSAFVYGFENEEKISNAILEYRPEDSRTILTKEFSSTVKITRSPVGVSFDMPQEILAGQETEIKINYVSNSESVLNNLVLQFEPPAGFSLKSANPSPEAGGKSWALKDLNPGDSGSIAIKGILSGGDLEEKSFKATVGTKNEFGEVSLYGRGVASINLSKPFLEVDAKVNGQDAYDARPGEILQVEVSYKNNLSVPVQNAVIEGVLSGKGFDEKQIRVEEGSYRAIDKKIIWNGSSLPALSQINPGQGGKIKFQFGISESPSIKTSSDKEFKTTINFTIRPGVIPPGVPGAELNGQDSMDVRLISRMQLVRKGFYYSAVISNSGPMPPRVGKETTFTVTLSLTNSSNDLENVIVKATLPAYVNWKSKILPVGSPVTFDQNTGAITWNVGQIKAGVGYTSPAKQLIFQIGFIPSPGQIGQAPELVSGILVQGKDKFTGADLEVLAPELTLALEDDGRIDISQTTVVK
ncbi:hypothetical protein HYT00_02115 [Candidatus Giovannonibacteria bacterium]|nr:hypothetical protein [Candidatus Giovannonibacteria bacterium]